MGRASTSTPAKASASGREAAEKRKRMLPSSGLTAIWSRQKT